MAFQPHGLTTAFLDRFFRIRYSSHSFASSLSAFSFSTLYTTVESANDELLEKQKESNHQINEASVLDQLSDLLPIRHCSIHRPLDDILSSEQSDAKAVDAFLSPEDKLRGVFLQKLRGRTAIKRALTSLGVELTVDVVSGVLNRGNLGGEDMVTFFNWAIEQPCMSKNIGSYHIILKALGRRKFFTYMLEMAHDLRIRGLSPDLETLSIVIDSFLRARRVSKAIQVFGQLDQFGLKCDNESFNVLLRCLCRRSHVGVANSLLSRMKEKFPFDGVTYNLIIGGWARVGRVTEIDKNLRAMVMDGFDPNSSTYSYIIEGLGRAGQIEEAIKIFESLEERGCAAAGTDVYNALISNFISIQDFDRCLRYYELMLSNNCNPNIDTYTKLISAFLRTRRVSDAIEMFDKMIGRGIIPTTGTVTSFLEPLCSYGPPHAALMIYKKARKAGCRISLNAYKLLLMRISKFGKCGMLSSIWDEMQESGYSSDVEVYEHIINGLCNIGQLKKAVLLMEESIQRGFCPNKLICSKLNNKLLTSRRIEIAYKLLLKIKGARHNENLRRYWRAKGWHF